MPSHSTHQRSAPTSGGSRPGVDEHDRSGVHAAIGLDDRTPSSEDGGWLCAGTGGPGPAGGSALLDLLLDVIEASVFVVDEEGKIVLANTRGSALLVANGDELLAFLRTGTSGPDGSTLAELGAWSRGPLRAWRRWFHGEGGVRYALVVVDQERALLDGVIEIATRSWSLTTRQIEVLRLVLAGQSTKEIATTLNAATRTIDAHLKALFEKANVSGRHALVSNAWQLERPGRLRP